MHTFSGGVVMDILGVFSDRIERKGDIALLPDHMESLRRDQSNQLERHNRIYLGTNRLVCIVSK